MNWETTLRGLGELELAVPAFDPQGEGGWSNSDAVRSWFALRAEPRHR
jgi:hypothetical protein